MDGPLHHASRHGPLEVVQALVAAGANPTATDYLRCMPLMMASKAGNARIVISLLQLPPIKASIDAIADNGDHEYTALFITAANGHRRIVQLLLDAGADPTIPPGHDSPLNQAMSTHHHAIAALLRHGMKKAKRARECVVVVERKGGLCEDVYAKLRGYLLPAWAGQGPAGV